MQMLCCLGLKITGRHRLISNDEMIYKYEGCDPFEDEKIDDQLLMKIEDDMKRKDILKILLNNEYSIAHKMRVIEVYRYLIDVGERKQSIYVEDLLADWNFDIK
jgi:hypothetical protein